MTESGTPEGPGRPPSAFQRWVAGVLEPLPQPLRIVLVVIVCIALVVLPLVLFLAG
jgi:hypothetical protein